MYHEYHVGKRALPNFPRIATIGLPIPTEKSLKADSSSEIDARDKVADEELSRDAGPLNVDGSPIGIEVDDLSLDLLLDEQLPAHSTGTFCVFFKGRGAHTQGLCSSHRSAIRPHIGTFLLSILLALL